MKLSTGEDRLIGKGWLNSWLAFWTRATGEDRFILTGRGGWNYFPGWVSVSFKRQAKKQIISFLTQPNRDDIYSLTNQHEHEREYFVFTDFTEEGSFMIV